MNKNYERIISLVENHFSLDKDSLAFFKKSLEEESYIAPEYRSIFSGGNKIRWELKGDEAEAIDTSWVSFKKYFSLFVEETKLTYEEYRANRFKKQGSPKVIKALIKKIVDDGEEISPHAKCFLEEAKISQHIFNGDKGYLKDVLERTLKGIESEKLPVGDLEVVLSCDYADWFMCSTAESWTSCIDLDSDWDSCYWAGLPGLIGDKNRALLYVTNKANKEAYGITTNRFMARTWALLDENSNIVLQRSYPNQFFIKTKFMDWIKGRLPIVGIMENSNYTSKYPVEKLFFNNKTGCFIFQDHCGFIIKNEEIFIRAGKSGYLTLDKDGYIIKESPIVFNGGLKYLVENNDKLENYYGELIVCNECGRAIQKDEEEFITPGGAIICKECFEEAYVTCSNCGETVHHDDSIDGMCGSCYEDLHFCCPSCGEWFHNDGATDVNGTWYCSYCAEGLSVCDDCGATCEEVEEIDEPKKKVCSHCFREKYFSCTGCGTSLENSKKRLIRSTGYCIECFEEKVE